MARQQQASGDKLRDQERLWIVEFLNIRYERSWIWDYPNPKDTYVSYFLQNSLKII